MSDYSLSNQFQLVLALAFLTALGLPNFAAANNLVPDLNMERAEADSLGCPMTETVIASSDGEDNDCFGQCVALRDGSLAAGAPGNEDMGHQSGSVYVFQDISGAGDWSSLRETLLIASDSGPLDWVGLGVDIDGRVVVAGNYYDDDFGERAGAVYLFVDTSPAGD